MTNLSSDPINSRLLPPEVIWLEPEQIEQAKAISERSYAYSSEHSVLEQQPLPEEQPVPEEQHWQIYLNALALLSFEQWLSDRLPEHTIERLIQPIESVCYVEVSGFKFCLIALEQVLDETVQIPQAVIELPELAAHFYVVQEVSEEQELVTMRGFLRFDELIHYRDRHQYRIEEGYYQFPLASLDAEPNHLLFYCRSLQPTAISLPTTTLTLPISTVAPDPVLMTLTDTATKLSQWLQGAFAEGWQAIEQLIHPDAELAFGTRSLEAGVRRGKLINLGVQLGQQAVALLVNVTSEAEDKLTVLVQLHPTGEARYLLPDLKLSLRSTTGKILQEVTSRSQDNYIQLKPFKGKSGKRFSIMIHLGHETIEENFQL